jgi:hypothetical protein
MEFSKRTGLNRSSYPEDDGGVGDERLNLYSRLT